MEGKRASAQVFTRSSLLISMFGPAASLGIVVCRWIYLHYGEPDFALELADFAVVLLPFAFSILFAFVPDMRTKHIAWRLCVIAGGIGFSFLLWEQQQLVMEASRRDQQRAVDLAVGNANQHSDQQMAVVRSDVKGVSEVAKKLDSRLDSLSKQVSKSESELNGSISKVGTSPVKYAELEFEIFDPNSRTPKTSQYLGPDADGIYTLDFTVTNISDTAASQGDIWVHLCDECTFAEEPSGFDRPPGLPEHSRHKVFQNLNPGVTLEKMTVKFRIAGGPYTATDALFNYSCASCGKMTDAQRIRNFFLQPLQPPKVR